MLQTNNGTLQLFSFETEVLGFLRVGVDVSLVLAGCMMWVVMVVYSALQLYLVICSYISSYESKKKHRLLLRRSCFCSRLCMMMFDSVVAVVVVVV